jgi:hypothetical protein
MAFNAEDYAWAIAHKHVTKKSERPVTLADHEAAERAARQLIEARLSDGCEDDTIPEISELEEGIVSPEGAICSIRDWGADINEEAEGWQIIAQDLLDFKAKKKNAA